MNIELNELQRICLIAILKNKISNDEFSRYLCKSTNDERMCHEYDYEINMQKSILELLQKED